MPFDQRHQKVSQSHFAMIPKSHVPRSVFRNRSGHKTTLDAGYCVPVYLNEILPGDTVRMNMTAFARMQPAVYPIMDNLYMDSFWFFVPCRLVWENWKYFMGEAVLGGLPTDYTVPVMASGVFSGASAGSLSDYFGLPSSDQVTGTLDNINALPFRAYQLIWDEWFRDQNLQSRIISQSDIGDGPDSWGSGADGVSVLRRRNKRHDYFTSALPFAQKGAAASIPLDGLAPIQGIGFHTTNITTNTGNTFKETARGNVVYPFAANTSQNDVTFQMDSATNPNVDPLIFADLSQAANASIELFRVANTLQLFMERDARGGTRYTELIRQHFGVASPDARLQRPEYLGGASSPIHINPVAQTSETATTPLGQLAGVGTGVHNSGFSQSFTEHGYLIGIVSIRADLTYQQGYHKLWTRSTKYDFYFPDFAHLGEQAILEREIFATGVPAADEVVFGYQERYAEYRYFPSKITGKFRSGITGTLDPWHLAQEFDGSYPAVLDGTFIEENPPMARVLSAGELTLNQQFLFDCAFDANYVRPMPMYSVPGLGGRF